MSDSLQPHDNSNNDTSNNLRKSKCFQVLEVLFCNGGGNPDDPRYAFIHIWVIIEVKKSKNDLRECTGI